MSTGPAPNSTLSNYSATHTILVTVFEGRNFTKRTESIYIQCRFNNEILTTDPVAQTANPIWDTELAWDIQHKQLSYLRSIRAPLKLVVYSLDTNTGQREVVGWIVLDLRAAQGGEIPTQKWYPLLAHGKSAFRPEVKIAFSVSPAKTKLDYLSPTSSPARPKVILQSQAESAEISTVTNSVKLLLNEKSITSDSKSMVQQSSESPQPPAQEPLSKKTISNLSVSFSLTNEGYFQVGKEFNDVLDITLWVTIAFAQHLDDLLTDISTQAPLSNVFCFYYSFLGNDITTQPFSNLIDPNFPAERASIRLKGSRKDLATLFQEIGKLVFYFCQESTVYGYADVEFTNLVSKLSDLKNEIKFPLVYESVYPLCFGGSKSKKPAGTFSKASIGVSLAVSLTKEPIDTNATAGIAIERKMEESDINITVESVKNQNQNQPALQSEPLSKAKKGVESESNEAKVTVTSEAPSQPILPLLQKDEVRVSFLDLKPSAPAEVSSNEGKVIRDEISDFDLRLGSTPADWHQFRFSIEMRSIRAFKLKSANVFLKYSYSPFGTSSPYISHPVTQLTCNEGEILLPHSFCSFEFAMAPKRLETYLESVPLIIEVFHKDPNRKNILIGSCSVDLAQVLQNRPFHSNLIPTDEIHSADFFSPIESLGPSADKFTTIGELRTLLALEDFGGLATHQKQNNPVSKEEKVPDIHDTLEYQTVLELELWRQNQQEIFEEKMKQKEKDLEETYAMKIKEAEKESEQILSAKLAEYSAKIAKLQTLSDQLQEREMSIQRAERDLVLEKANLEREAAAALQSQRDAARRLEESFAHSFGLLKQRAEDAEKKNEASMKERDAFRQRVMELEVKGQAAKAGDTNFSEEIVKLSSEIMTLKAQNERLVASRHDMKKKYKTLFRLYTAFKSTSEDQLKEIQALKTSKAQEEERAGVIKKELASLEKENMEIKSISKAVHELKKAVTPSLPPTPQPLDPTTKLNIERLQKEKMSLLDGAYTAEDELILGLDAKIQELQRNQV